MDCKLLIYGLASLLLLSSCSQIKSLTSRDTSSTRATGKKSAGKDVTFIDGISVTPGQQVTSRHTTPAVTTGRRRTKNEPETGGDIEKASFLQLKYAIMLDASVEKLDNPGLLKLIDEWWGTRYCMGGSTKNCIDCSAFVQVIMSNVYNVSVPRTAQEQYNNGSKIGMEELEEGDLVFFHTGGRDISHVGVYMLNNKFVHASTSGGVMFNDLNDNYWRSRFRGATRVTTQAGTR